ncbi:MAG: autotransporter assembly complex family protein [Sedimenticolaceae bacterium]
MKRLLPVLVILGALTPQARGEVTIEVPGGEAALEENLRARLRLSTQACDAPAWRVRRLFGRAEEDFQPALRAFGYYSATVEEKLETGGDCWEATFDIVLGKRTTIRERRIIVKGEASKDPQLQGLLKTLPLAEGAPLNHADYEAIKERLRRFAAQYGYLDFEFSRQELRVYPREAVADIVLEADSGVRYRFGELRFGELPVDEKLVRRLAKIREGEPYNAAALLAMNRHLSDSGYFHRVEVRARRAEAKDDRVPIDILLEPAKRHAWRAGIGFATDTGPRLTLRYDNRYVNSLGHHFESTLSVSPVLSGLNLDYVIPGEDPLRESFSFGAQLKHEDTDTALSDSVTLAARQTVKSERWTQTRFLELLHEKSTVADQDTTSTLLMPGIGLDRIKADDLLRARHGYRARMEVRGAYDGLVSTATLLQLKTHAKGVHRFGEGGRLSVRADAGWTLTDSTVDLPASLRFFAGGDNSVRGYRYRSLGPRDGDGDVKGGKHLLTGSVEYEHPVFGEDGWVAAFIDAGNAFDTNDVDVRYGYGLGVRWYSPVGRVRLDVAIPDDTEDDNWRLHFGLGADL